ncbi:MAG: VWA domain-containing protein [Chthoniobacterales bacterium]
MNTDYVKITSYLLNELDGETRMAFEQEMATSADLQNAVAEIQKMRDLLLAMPVSTEELSAEQRTFLRNQCLLNVQHTQKKRANFRNAVTIGGLAIAACVLFAFIMPRRDKGGLPRPSVAKNQEMSEDINVIAKMKSPSPALPESNKKMDELAFVLSESRAVTSLLPSEETSKVHAPFIPRNLEALGKTEGKVYTESVGEQASGLVASDTKKDGYAGEKNSADKVYDTGQLLTGAIAPTAPPASQKVDGFFAGIVAVRDRSAPKLQTTPVAGGVDAKTARILSRTAANITPQIYSERDNYTPTQENEFFEARSNPLSTFSIDVDTASYSNIRRFLNSEQLPPQDAVRTEELINYFSYAYPQPAKDVPFSVNTEVAQAPWNTQHLLVRIGLKGRELSVEKRPASNFVFLIDVSGSMDSPERLPLLKRCLEALVKKLSPEDRVAIVVYAGSSGIALPSTSCKDKEKILAALNNLNAGGSTNGAQGIQLAYNVARENFLKKGNNRVILCTDGDFNVGITSKGDLTKLIEDERTSGIFLSALGFGTNNLKDATMINLADKGNGNYAYVDSFAEGRKVLVEQLTGTLFTIAKDVKIQVEFNPAQVAGYRLIGYEKRLLAKEDFNDDKKDAGEIGAGHTVTAFYEVVPAGQALPGNASVDPLKYQKPETTPAFTGDSKELMTVKLRYKEPTGDTSKLIVQTINAQEPEAFEKASGDFQFSAAVAAYGMKLRNSPYYGDLTWNAIQQIARRSLGEDPGSYRAEFLTLIEKARHLDEGKRE